MNVSSIGDVLWVSPDPKPDRYGVLHIPPEIRETRLYDDPVKRGKMKVLEPEYRYSDFGKCLVGTVSAIGPGKHNGRKFVPTELKPGDRVLIPPNRGVEKSYDGRDWLILRERDVYMKLEQGE